GRLDTDAGRGVAQTASQGDDHGSQVGEGVCPGRGEQVGQCRGGRLPYLVGVVAGRVEERGDGPWVWRGDLPARLAGGAAGPGGGAGPAGRASGPSMPSV